MLDLGKQLERLPRPMKVSMSYNPAEIVFAVAGCLLASLLIGRLIIFWIWGR